MLLIQFVLGGSQYFIGKILDSGATTGTLYYNSKAIYSKQVVFAMDTQCFYPKTLLQICIQ